MEEVTGIEFETESVPETVAPRMTVAGRVPSDADSFGGAVTLEEIFAPVTNSIASRAGTLSPTYMPQRNTVEPVGRLNDPYPAYWSSM